MASSLTQTYKCQLAGVTFHKQAFTEAKVATGERLTLKAEPTNAYDVFAIAVYKGARHVGYVPRTHNMLIHLALVQRPQAVVCLAEAVRPGACTLRITIKPEEPA